jgi:hypothetical protein
LLSAIQVYGTQEALIANNLGFDIVTPWNDSAIINNEITNNLELVKKALNMKKSNDYE